MKQRTNGKVMYVHVMKIRSPGRSIESSRGSVQNDTKGNQQSWQLIVHANKHLDGHITIEQRHGGEDNVGTKLREEEGNVGTLAPASAKNSAHGMGAGRDILQGNEDDAKEEDLYGGSGGVPMRVEDS